jgi:hypothetical protein
MGTLISTASSWACFSAASSWARLSLLPPHGHAQEYKKRKKITKSQNQKNQKRLFSLAASVS